MVGPGGLTSVIHGARPRGRHFCRSKSAPCRGGYHLVLLQADSLFVFKPIITDLKISAYTLFYLQNKKLSLLINILHPITHVFLINILT